MKSAGASGAIAAPEGEATCVLIDLGALHRGQQCGVALAVRQVCHTDAPSRRQVDSRRVGHVYTGRVGHGHTGRVSYSDIWRIANVDRASKRWLCPAAMWELAAPSHLPRERFEGAGPFGPLPEERSSHSRPIDTLQISTLTHNSLAFLLFNLIE
jgi:hypothetical protein